MTKTLKLNTALFFALLLISGFAIYHQLGDFAHLKNADGVLTDMRSMVLWDIRFPRIGLALLTEQVSRLPAMRCKVFFKIH